MTDCQLVENVRVEAREISNDEVIVKQPLDHLVRDLAKVINLVGTLDLVAHRFQHLPDEVLEHLSARRPGQIIGAEF